MTNEMIEFDDFYYSNFDDLVVKFLDSKNYPEAYEDWVSDNPKYKGAQSLTDEMIDSFFDWVEKDTEWSVKWERFCELEYNDMLAGLADVADIAYERYVDDSIERGTYDKK